MNLYYNDNLTSKVRELGLPKVNKFKIKKPKSKIKMERCEEHQLYLYLNGLNNVGERIMTCKLGCLEFHK